MQLHTSYFGPESKLNRSFPDDIVKRTTGETFQPLSPSHEITRGVQFTLDTVTMCQSAVAESVRPASQVLFLSRLDGSKTFFLF